MGKKISKNLQKVQDMLDGNNTGKLQVGMHISDNVHEGRKVGDKWTDSDGVEWEQMNGYRSKVSRMPDRGIADQCKDCDMYITKPWDKELFRSNQRCYYCQIEFEAVLKSTGKYDAWIKEKNEQWVKDFEKDNKQLVEEIEKLENPFDKSVVNALANANVDSTIKVNKKLTN